MNKPWYKRNPKLAQEIRADLFGHYSSLHLFISDGKSEVRGTFPVLSVDGKVLDRYLVAIELLCDYPNSLPVVREVGGRIPWSDDFHVETDGKACVLMPDDRWRCFPEGAPFLQFLDGPLHDFFLGQSLVALGGDWPFGQWKHGAEGVYEYYQELLEAQDERTVRRFLHVLAKLNLKTHWDCPCGSGRKIRKCCASKIVDLRGKIPPAVARAAVNRLGGDNRPYKGPRIC